MDGWIELDGTGRTCLFARLRVGGSDFAIPKKGLN